MVQLAARARRTSEERPVEYPIYFEQATIFCLCVIIPSTLRATRAPWPSRAGPPSSLRVELKSDTSTFERERHRACLSAKTSNDEPSYVPLQARILGASLCRVDEALFEACPRKPRAGFQGHYGGSQLVLTLYRMHFFCFQMCNRLPEMMENWDAGIFPVYYSLNVTLIWDLGWSYWQFISSYF